MNRIINDIIEILHHYPIQIGYIKNNKQYKRFFEKDETIKYEDVKDIFCFKFNNDEIKIKVTDICTYSYPNKEHGELYENSFYKRIEKEKNDYLFYCKISNHLNADFDDLFFNVEVDRIKLKLCCLLKFDSLDFNVFDNSHLDNFKKIWIEQIHLQKIKISKNLNEEKINESVFDDKKIIEDIESLVINYDVTDDLNRIETNHDLFQFWPTILLPAPDLINEIFTIISSSPLSSINAIDEK